MISQSIISLFALLMIASAMLINASPLGIVTDPDAEDIKFYDLSGLFGKSWKSGELVTFKIKIEHKRHHNWFADGKAKVYLERSEIGPNDVIEMKNAQIIPDPSDRKKFTIRAIVPPVQHKDFYKVKIKRDTLIPGVKDTIAKSNSIDNFFSIRGKTGVWVSP